MKALFAQLTPLKRDVYLAKHWKEHLFSADERVVREVDALVETGQWQAILDRADTLTLWSRQVAGSWRSRKDDPSATRAAYCRLDGWWDGVLSTARHHRSIAAEAVAASAAPKRKRSRKTS